MINPKAGSSYVRRGREAIFQAINFCVLTQWQSVNYWQLFYHHHHHHYCKPKSAYFVNFKTWSGHTKVNSCRHKYHPRFTFFKYQRKCGLEISSPDPLESPEWPHKSNAPTTLQILTLQTAWHQVPHCWKSCLNGVLRLTGEHSRSLDKIDQELQRMELLTTEQLNSLFSFQCRATTAHCKAAARLPMSFNLCCNRSSGSNCFHCPINSNNLAHIRSPTTNLYEIEFRLYLLPSHHHQHHTSAFKSLSYYNSLHLNGIFNSSAQTLFIH